MSKKILLIATVLRAHVLVFHLPYMKWFQEQGYEVHVAAKNDTGAAVEAVPYCDRYFDLPFARSPFGAENKEAYRQLKILINEGEYVLIHCNTPEGGMLGRLSARDSRKHGSKIVYTAHGFHFFSGAPLKNWLLFYPAERFLSRYTDLLVTINQEDYKRAQSFHAKQVALVNGVGVDLSRFDIDVNKSAVRESVGIPPEAFVVINVGEHIPRKNHETVLRAVKDLPLVHLLFCGIGEREKDMKKLACELGIDDRTHFLGFRKDVPQLLMASDVFFFPSLQEGLPVSQMEAMAAGLPCVVSDVRGNADLIEQGVGGMLRAPKDADGFAEDIALLLGNPAMREEMGKHNENEIQKYGLDEVRNQMTSLYRGLLGEGVK